MTVKSSKKPCPTCGTQLPSGKSLRFCPFCGSALAESAKVSKPEAKGGGPSLEDFEELSDGYIVPLPPSAPRSLDRKMILLIVAGTLLLAIVATSAYLLVRLMPGEDDDASVATNAPPPVRLTIPPASDPQPNVGIAPVTSTGGITATQSTTAPTTVPVPKYATLTPSPPEADAKRSVLTEAAINDSIRRGVEFVLAQYKGTELMSPAPSHTYYDGVTALTASALIYTSGMVDDPRLAIRGDFMRGVLDRLKALPLADNHTTYTRALRLTTLALAARDQDRKLMTDDLQFLLKSVAAGGFGYGKPLEGTPLESIGRDNSNSQYGVLGVWAAAEAGLPVPQTFWTDVEKFWLDRQTPEGGWSYSGKDSKPTETMTAAGITSLFLTTQHAVPAGGARNLVAGIESLERALDWIGKENRMMGAFSNSFPGYALYGVERAGLASGYRYFGDSDWFLTLTPKIIETQNKDGSWPGEATPAGETAFRLLFLSRGSHPILMTKLQFDGKWNNRPTDLVALTRYAGNSLERRFNWQSVPVTQPWQNWTGSPVAYLASSEPPNIDEAGLSKIRSFVEHGGLLFTHADRGSKTLSDWVEATAKELFPEYPMVDVPEDHPIYSVAALIKKKQPLRMVTNGSRVLMLHSPTDVAGTWDRRNERSNPDGFGLGVNVSVLATGLNPFRSRLQSVYEQGPDKPVTGAFPVVRITHGSNWNAEPAAWGNFGRWFGGQRGIGISEVAAAPASLDAFEQPVAHLSGTSKYTPSPDEVASLRRYVMAGGILLVDATGGSIDFVDSVGTVIGTEVAVGVTAVPLTPTHPLVSTGATWPSILEVETRSTVGGRPEGADLRPQVYPVGKGYILLMDRDLTTGLLGANVWNMRGYTIGWSRAMMKNLIIATIERAKTGNR